MRPHLLALSRVPIAVAQRASGLTPRAIRLYEERGLIEAHRDRRNCRYYDRVALARLVWISRLRRAGLTMAEIADLLIEDGGGIRAECAATKLKERQAAAFAQLAVINEALSEITGAASEPDERRLHHKSTAAIASRDR